MSELWKSIYSIGKFSIQKRVSRNIIEDKEIKKDEQVKFQFDINGVFFSYEISKDKLLDIINQPIIKYSERK